MDRKRGKLAMRVGCAVVVAALIAGVVEWKAIACAVIAGYVDRTSDPAKIVRARKALVWIGPASAPALARMAEQEDTTKLRQAFLGAFYLREGPGAEDAYRSLLADPRPRARTIGAAALALAPRPDVDATRILIANLEAEDPDLRFFSAFELTGSSPAMFERVTNDPAAVLARMGRALAERVGDHKEVTTDIGFVSEIETFALTGLNELVGEPRWQDGSPEQARERWRVLRTTARTGFFRR